MKYKLYDVPPISDINDMLNRARYSAGGSVAFRFKNNDILTEISYAEFCHDVNSLAAAISTLSEAGDHIACLSENRYKWINTFLSALSSKSVFVPIDRDLLEEDVVNVLDHSDSRIIFCSGRYEELIRRNLSRLSKVRYVVCFDRKEDEDRFLSFEALRERGEQKLLSEGGYTPPYPDSSSLAMIIYTSGTMGMPKGVMLSERNITASVEGILSLCRLEGSCLSMLPYSQGYEAICGLLCSIHSHATVCINDPRQNIKTNLNEYNPQYLFTVPAFLEAIYRNVTRQAEEKGKKRMLNGFLELAKRTKPLHIPVGKGLLSALRRALGGQIRKIICGGAPLRSEVAEFFELAGISVIHGYGLTECSPLAALNHDRYNDFKTAGFPLPGLEIDIVNPARDDNGELRIKGETVTKGYYKSPGETENVIDEEGFFLTGDRGHLTAEGRLVVTGRSKNLIILSNARIVHPEEIEAHLYTISYIKEAVVYGIREEGGIREICAEVYIDPEKETDLEEQSDRLRRDVTETLSKLPLYKQVSRIVIRPQEFPKTAQGKIKRGELGI